MGMGLVNDSDFEKELINSSGSVNKINPNVRVEILDKEPEVTNGRRPSDVAVPDSLKKLIGITSLAEGRSASLELARQLDISSSQVSSYSAGRNSPDINSTNTDLTQAINKTKIRISRKAQKKLVLALDSMTEDKLSNAKATDLSIIAKNMSSIMTDMEPAKESNPINNNNGPTFVFFKPEVKNESEFGIVHSRE